MNDVLQLEIATICLFHIIAIGISVIALMILYMKSNKTDSLKAFIYVDITMIIWMIFKIFKTVAPTVEIRWWCIVAYYGAICLLEAAFLEFGYIYYKKRPFTKKTRLFIYIIPTIQFIIILTNPYHYLFYSKYDFYMDRFGVLFYFHMFFEYLYILIGFIFCARRFRTQLQYTSKLYRYLVSIAIIMPVILNFVYISGTFRRFIYATGLKVIFDITPIVFTISLLLFVYVTFKYEFFNLSPIMEHEIIYELDTPICVLSSSYNVSFANDKIKNMFDDTQDINAIIKNNIEKIKSTSYDTEIEIWQENRCFFVFIKPIERRSEVEYLMTFNEITIYKQIENETIKKKKEFDAANIQLNKTIETLKETSKMGARNFVARELHDILGHSLVVTIKLLEVAGLYYKKDYDLSTTALKEAVESIDNGVFEMRAIRRKTDKDNIYSSSLLEKDLGKMLEHIKSTGIKTDLIFKGTLYILDEAQFDIIKKVCTELVTNALKHSKATRIVISVNINNLNINILVIDNGIGCDEIKKGNGLKGIESRLEIVGGKVEYNSNSDEGFSIHISIPQTKIA